MVTDWMTLAAADGHALSAYRALPAGKPLGGVVVIQEIFGVNDHVRRITEELAAAGFAAVAPALFDRYERNVDLGYTDDDRQKGMAFMSHFDFAKALADVAAAKAALAPIGKVGIVGFCLGGTIAYLSACRQDFDASVGYYGGGIARFPDDRPRGPLMLHFGEADAHIPLSVGEKVKAESPAVEVYTYPGGHGFMRKETPAAYDEASAVLSWQRSLDFLKLHLA
ncbi:dienelactone hydrolase family protein [Oryzibacter oryziterrae]|uniref:dienelactone hydrolase family protein n=1 Tax=Oryzibacter oryziterrae TaxID=2766474 RepID=UPI001F3C337F|nr:dienelactone hydrolase family protein [Oryzibacter oryziterrae]